MLAQPVGKCSALPTTDLCFLAKSLLVRCSAPGWLHSCLLVLIPSALLHQADTAANSETDKVRSRGRGARFELRSRVTVEQEAYGCVLCLLTIEDLPPL